ncbi:hypothetical protein NECAME_06108 [Necator americanus]|uniref:Uncharacterized protein n=1 Tax=Necator americanus TaxID=51031 RepID=W2TW12_NECAM|nr:hypothetical protein NECAME_06108 [Necator americanus]ETN86033.1 hypothetical protein NECAME_06108 [Necator americanus]
MICSDHIALSPEKPQVKTGGSAEKAKPSKRSGLQQKSKIVPPKDKQGTKRSSETGGEKKKTTSKSENVIADNMHDNMQPTQPEEFDKVATGGAYYLDEGQDETIEDAPSLKRIYLPPSE